jgi:hypothetical protein
MVTQKWDKRGINKIIYFAFIQDAINNKNEVKLSIAKEINITITI